MAIGLNNITNYMFRTIYEREYTYNKFKPYFCRFIGVDDSSKYNDFIKTIESKFIEEKDKCIIFDNSIFSFIIDENIIEFIDRFIWNILV